MDFFASKETERHSGNAIVALFIDHFTAAKMYVRLLGRRPTRSAIRTVNRYPRQLDNSCVVVFHPDVAHFEHAHCAVIYTWKYNRNQSSSNDLLDWQLNAVEGQLTILYKPEVYFTNQFLSQLCTMVYNAFINKSQWRATRKALI